MRTLRIRPILAALALVIPLSTHVASAQSQLTGSELGSSVPEINSSAAILLGIGVVGSLALLEAASLKAKKKQA